MSLAAERSPAAERSSAEDPAELSAEDRAHAVPGAGSAVVDRLRQLGTALETADALDRAAHRIRNPRVAELLHERAEARRRTARWAREHLAGRAPCPDPARDVALRIRRA